MKEKKSKIDVQGFEIAVVNQSNNDYISLTDIAKQKNAESTGLVIAHWLSTKFTIEFMGLWEQMHNKNFNVTEFRNIKNEAGSNGFILSSKQWIDKTNAIGLTSSAGRYGGTFAHKDIAFEFASWISAEFKLYLIKEFQRLKEEENSRLSLEWKLNRTLSMLNYRIHTDAIKEHIIPKNITKDQANFVYASEADVLNVALFGKTAKQWREENKSSEGNIRDYATIEQLLVLANIESMNAEFIRMEIPQKERLLKLNQIAILQLKSITTNDLFTKLKE
ncbi:KilA-N domain-containing protein [Flavobacterium azooxidireducens]|uniref:KilA-N domain-containing protein n=1 Tax=Flavobacterium azooxidireducens TaxID=1871076 RepID=A0ABY4KH75_9FLAO|nr:KilA-N domain-containing protein [Flavobacterium azooxidireducens]UPQ78787.1 KilA-N domain-containing protein [Flavobacterium azooxidireducens]